MRCAGWWGSPARRGYRWRVDTGGLVEATARIGSCPCWLAGTSTDSHLARAGHGGTRNRPLHRPSASTVSWGLRGICVPATRTPNERQLDSRPPPEPRLASTASTVGGGRLPAPGRPGPARAGLESGTCRSAFTPHVSGSPGLARRLPWRQYQVRPDSLLRPPLERSNLEHQQE